MFVLLAIALSIYGLVNFYIGRRGAQALAAAPAARRIFLVLFIGLALLFPAGRLLMAVARGRLTSALVEVGTFHMAVMLYGFMAVLAIDLVRLVNAFVPFLPKSLFGESARTGPVIFAAAAGAVALTIAWGAWNATRLRTVELDLKVPRKAGVADGLTVVLASDLHLGEIIGPSRLEKVVARINVLDPDVVLRADGGLTGLSRHVQGAESVAGQALLWSRVDLTMRRALINGAAGLISIRGVMPFSVLALTVKNGRIVEIDILADPERLARLDLTVLDE